ncbi:MAG: CcoQ/FixQ family Cbb3-type cytochrome c oxidase assembly chaperone [Schleiferiaceae bacterium]|jgi:cbb3-type cytochrome oxidase subunit 3|nr:CcoQ/FixQ family Cbb3-type cytochrome c oxidase assembly chaperone [Schleiferiaceae bacterium]
MLKFIKHHMATIADIEIYPLISLAIFFLFFVGLIVYVILSDKKTIAYISNLPLEDKTKNNE